MTVSRSPQDARRRSWLHRWAVPALVIGVALQQVLWVHTAGLDPWKGGGFGMFSKIENRILRTQMVRGEGPSYSIDLTSKDPLFRLAKDRAITMPDESALTAVAQAILDAEFVPEGFEQHLLLRELAGPSVAASQPGSWRRYRMLSAGEHWPRDEEVVRFQQVRVQVWRFHFDADSATVSSEPVGPLVELER